MINFRIGNEVITTDEFELHHHETIAGTVIDVDKKEGWIAINRDDGNGLVHIKHNLLRILQ